MANILYIVLPCYNEVEVLPETTRRMEAKLGDLKERGKVSPKSRILYVDDGSSDGSWEFIKRLHEEKPESFSALKLTRNRGHQNALLAGLMTVKELCDVTISLDADLQDDINAVDDMIDKYLGGAQIVYGIRGDRSSDTVFKRSTAQLFYKIMGWLGVSLVYNHADYRLMSSKALDGLAQFPEANLFLRGMVPLIGYPSDVVQYHRGERFAGESKYPLSKMISFAWQGVSSFSTNIFMVIVWLGVAVAAIGALLGVWAVVKSIRGLGGNWVLMSVWLLAGMQIGILGILGEYLGKIYAETKRRPKYIIDKFLDSENKPD